MRPSYAAADRRLRDAVRDLNEYLNGHGGVVRSNTNVMIELRQALVASERQRDRPEEIHERQRRYREDHAEEIRCYQAAYYQRRKASA